MNNKWYISKRNVVLFTFLVLLLMVSLFRWETITQALQIDLDPASGADDTGFIYARDRLTGLIRTFYIVDDIYASFTYQNPIIMQGLSYVIGVLYFLLFLAYVSTDKVYEKIDFKTISLLIVLISLITLLYFRWETIEAYPNGMLIIEQDRITSTNKITEIRGTGFLSETAYQSKIIIIMTYLAMYLCIAVVVISLKRHIKTRVKHNNW